MRRLLTFAAAAAALTATTTFTSAQNATDGYYITGTGEDRMVMSQGGGEGTRLLQGENGARPADCPAGSFYDTGNGIGACDNDAMFTAMQPESGTRMGNGEAFPENSMMLQPMETGSSKEGQDASATGSGSTGDSTGGSDGGNAGGGDAGGGNGGGDAGGGNGGGNGGGG